MGLKSGFGHFFSEKQLPYLENCKTISHIMIVMTVNSAFYYITGSKGSASFVCKIGLNIESCWKYYRKRVFFYIAIGSEANLGHLIWKKFKCF